MNPIVTTCWTIGCITIALVALGAMTWSIRTAYHRAETRLQHVISTHFAETDAHRNTYLARSRAIDDEYRQLILETHTDD